MAPSIAESSPGGTSTAQKPTVYVLDTFPPKIQPSDPEFQHWRQNARALLVRGSYVTAADIASCPNLVAIGKHGVGIDKIDQAACQARGIRNLNTPGANARDVAELVVTLALAVARGIRSITTRQMVKPVPKETYTRSRCTARPSGSSGWATSGARWRRSSMGGSTPVSSRMMPTAHGVWEHLPHVRAQSVEEVIAQADVLSLHVPLTEETRGMLSYAEIKRMKPNAILINAARGGNVNEAGLERALSEGHLWGVGLDCHEQEPSSRERYGAL